MEVIKAATATQTSKEIKVRLTEVYLTMAMEMVVLAEELEPEMALVMEQERDQETVLGLAEVPEAGVVEVIHLETEKPCLNHHPNIFVMNLENNIE